MYRKRIYRKESNPATTPEDISLRFATQSWETGIKYYSLSARVSTETWGKIAPYFEFIKGNSEECEEDGVEDLYGWYTTAPTKVEEILGVKPENTLAAQEEEYKKYLQAETERLNRIAALYDRINELFRNKEYPDPRKEQPDEAEKYMPGLEKMKVVGEVIEDPNNPPNIYGGGKWWIIQKEEWIWEVHNNGADGDDWSRNNLLTGGAGAIGFRVPYNEELAELIRSLKKSEPV